MKITTKRIALLMLVAILAGCKDCGPEVEGLTLLEEPKEEAIKAVEFISEILGINADFEVYAATFKPGASPIAYAKGCGENYIVYDKYILFVSEQKSMTWVDVGVLAHEIIHHTSGATYQETGSIKELEREADTGSGHIIRMMGGSLEQAKSYSVLLNIKESATHPGREERIEAITEGWERADRLLYQNHLL